MSRLPVNGFLLAKLLSHACTESVLRLLVMLGDAVECVEVHVSSAPDFHCCFGRFCVAVNDIAVND